MVLFGIEGWGCLRRVHVSDELHQCLVDSVIVGLPLEGVHAMSKHESMGITTIQLGVDTYER